VFLLEIIMSRITFPCPECKAPITLASAQSGEEIRCPDCGAWVSIPSHVRESTVSSADEGGSNAALWIGLAVGGGFLLLLLVCGGVGALLWFLRAQAGPSRVMGPVAVKSATPATPAQIAFSPPTQFPPQTEDYAEARKKFTTKLVRVGPAPQRSPELGVPPGVTEIDYASGDLRLKARVSSAPGAGQEKKPAVLYLHNGFAFGDDDWKQAQPLRDAGYVVMIPMLRGENGLKGSYSLFYNEVDDVLAAADALAKLPYVDAKRIYLAGHSNGGTLTLLTALTTPRFRAAAAFSGSPDQVNWGAVRSNLGGYVGDQGGPIPFDEEDRKEFEMRSPLAFPESFKCPVRLYFGDQEALSKASNQKLAELAKKKKLDVEAVEVPGDHLSAVIPAMRQCIEFFEKR
jgi:dienelactone hydrolase/DNA-directed RNA polymerase subunit RPC12/RpoP